MLNDVTEQVVIRTPPDFTYDCECGIHIKGQSEKGLSSLLKKHKVDGVLHLEWLEKGKI
jgi:hypothetical protein